MYNGAKEILDYHDEKVTLPQSERDAMRLRRDSNRDRIKRGLEKNEKPKPVEFASQGSYAMRTMTQHPEKDYDIDDGIYFHKEDLINSDGVELTPLEARQMIRDAVDDGSFNTAPEVCNNCVRIYYEAGYHVDIPVYRRVVTETWSGDEEVHYELASGDDWVRSDARDVTSWFLNENRTQSPDTTNGQQLRRICREIKKFSTSRSDWKEKIGSGLMITKLVTERYYANVDREDEALYYTMKAIRDRLETDLIVKHPVTPDSTITKGSSDPKARFLKEKLSEAIEDLQILFESDCTDEQAMKAWDTAFNTTYFSDKLAEKKKNQQNAATHSASATANTGLLKDWSNSSPPPVQKHGGGRYA